MKFDDHQVEVAVAVEVGRRDVGRLDPRHAASRPGRNVPSPLPSRIETVSAMRLVTARSGMPSPLKSPTATSQGPRPTGTRIGARKVPSPRPSRIETSLVLVVGDDQVLDAVAGEVGRDHVWGRRRRSTAGGGAWKVPSPLPRSTETVSLMKSAVTRSARPSPVRSAAAMPVVDGPDRDRPAGLEGPVALAEEDRDVAGPVAARGQVELAVAVEVGRGQRVGERAGLEHGRGDEPPVLVLEDPHRVVAGAGHGQVGPAVAVEVGGDHASGRPGRSRAAGPA